MPGRQDEAMAGAYAGLHDRPAAPRSGRPGLLAGGQGRRDRGTAPPITGPAPPGLWPGQMRFGRLAGVVARTVASMIVQRVLGVLGCGSTRDEDAVKIAVLREVAPIRPRYACHRVAYRDSRACASARH